jgi:cytoskeleton protein RodZ
VPAYVASADDWLLINAKSEVWVEALTARGGVAFRRVLKAGETVGLANAAPLRVTVGRADGVSVTVRGKPLDLQANSRDNVARFEAR